MLNPSHLSSRVNKDSLDRHILVKGFIMISVKHISTSLMGKYIEQNIHPVEKKKERKKEKENIYHTIVMQPYLSENTICTYAIHKNGRLELREKQPAITITSYSI